MSAFEEMRATTNILVELVVDDRGRDVETLALPAWYEFVVTLRITATAEAAQVRMRPVTRAGGISLITRNKGELVFDLSCIQRWSEGIFA